jgi:leucyl-tRNA synthetase
MSKSKGNTINPDEYISRYGSDVFRTFLAFGFAYTEGGPWSDDGVRAVAKFISRIEKLVEDTLPLRQGTPSSLSMGQAEKELRFVRHHAIRSVTADADRFQFNTSISRMMELLNAIQKYLADGGDNTAELVGAVDDLLRLLAPFAPHFTEEMWELTGRSGSIFDETWPEHDPAALVRDAVEIAVQLNGAIKFRIEVPTAAGQERSVNRAGRPPHAGAAVRPEYRQIHLRPGRLANVVQIEYPPCGWNQKPGCPAGRISFMEEPIAQESSPDSTCPDLPRKRWSDRSTELVRRIDLSSASSRS